MPGTHVHAGSSKTPQVAYFINISLPTSTQLFFSGVSYRNFFQVSDIAKLGTCHFKVYLFANLLCSYLVMVSVAQIIYIYIYMHAHVIINWHGYTARLLWPILTYCCQMYPRINAKTHENYNSA